MCHSNNNNNYNDRVRDWEKRFGCFSRRHFKFCAIHMPTNYFIRNRCFLMLHQRKAHTHPHTPWHRQHGRESAIQFVRAKWGRVICSVVLFSNSKPRLFRSALCVRTVLTVSLLSWLRRTFGLASNKYKNIISWLLRYYGRRWSEKLNAKMNSVISEYAQHLLCSRLALFTVTGCWPI